MEYIQTISNVYMSASLFLIPLAIFTIIDDILTSLHLNINDQIFTFFITLVNGVTNFFGLYWVLRVYFPPRPASPYNSRGELISAI